MSKGKLILIAIGAAAVLGCSGGRGGKDSAAVDQAYEETLAKRRATDRIEDRLAITKAFLKAHPESRYTADAVYAVIYYQGEALGDMGGAIAYAERIRGGIDDPEIARDVDRELLHSYADNGMSEKMTALAGRLSAAGAMRFEDYQSVIEGAVMTEDWALVREYCASAQALATAEAVRAEDPENEMTPEQLAETVDDHKGLLLAKDAWARVNQGQVDGPLADFAKADRLVPRYYFGIPEYGLNVYWARALIEKGEFEKAIDRLAVDALIMRNDDALGALRDAYVGVHGDDSGYEAFCVDLQHQVAPKIDEFEMSDYQGERHRFSDLRGDVTLLALWFPT